ncbi:hypothetical protein EDEG_01523 [Edhazardia aedis USNM 41457]|uniref:Uncharacterized protein n=1 Tax=Edhazardia aedis (strain USNM 41457) TaxID=1003232 RepID=J9D8V7_EDHAE|nr:hypothetical protein EDEG_01523 [Edhazardia aedis USNM 41457]|eukprot:EJW04191.1 hypothetical protein EDEG_01523 [Edhazardia aedis USNM 41457]
MSNEQLQRKSFVNETMLLNEISDIKDETGEMSSEEHKNLNLDIEQESKEILDKERANFIQSFEARINNMIEEERQNLNDHNNFKPFELTQKELMELYEIIFAIELHKKEKVLESNDRKIDSLIKNEIQNVFIERKNEEMDNQYYRHTLKDSENEVLEEARKTYRKDC